MKLLIVTILLFGATVFGIAQQTDSAMPKPSDESAIPTTTEVRLEDPMMIVEKMPQFPGGQEAMMRYLMENIKYPAEAKENAIAGRVAVQFTVEKDGSLTNATILRDIGGGCGAEALRLVAGMPKWEPGMQHGRPVRVRYTMPLLFKLD